MSEHILNELDAVIHERRGQAADSSYVASLFASGLEKIQKKVSEEALETILAAEQGDAQKVVAETADLWFHSLVLLAESGVSSAEVLQELERRFGLSGLEEKANRPSKKG